MKKRLNNITLLGLDTNTERLKNAFKICEHYFDFGAKKILTTTDNETTTDTGIQIINRPCYSREEYSQFMIKESNKYVDTDYVLIIHYDGFILNPEARTDDFLQYDYIGAPRWYNDNNNVGNGGFSLRSKKLLEILANDKNIIETMPEDHHICRTYGDYLRSKGIKFAPEEIAKKFSIEGALQPPAMPVKYGSIRTNELGFHGLQKTDISNRKDRDLFFPTKYNINDYTRK